MWLLRPGNNRGPWEPWYDKTFGFVVRAETEEEARRYAQEEGGDETETYPSEHPVVPAWTDAKYSTCVELVPEGKAGVIIEDKAHA